MKYPCTSCEYHKGKNNPTKGITIPGVTGKCTRTDGLCEKYAKANKVINAPADPDIVDLADTTEAMEAPLVPEISEERGMELKQTQNTDALVAQAIDNVEEVFKDLGRLEATTFFATVADSMTIQIFQKVKKSKAYKNLHFCDENGNLRPFQNIEEFCKEKLGKSYRRMQELSKNFNSLGPELYESAERIGFRNKDYRALNALPEGEQAVVKEAIAAENKEEVLDILQDMTERHVQEREEAKKESNELKADLEARDKLLKDKSTRLEKAETELFKLKSLPPDADLELKLAREEKAVERLHKEHVAILAAIKPFMQVVSEVLGDGDISAHTKEHAVFETRQVCGAINQFLMDCSIPVDFAEMVYPEWMRGNAQADLEAGNTEEPNDAHGSW
ncbi:MULTISPECIES: hypothetical protein [unclassified Maridesulfovibrio]|uniref:hypothetical protein n=1 Tax=unclassified Maridesulfovibrio TaxID=2794999 RepID=UPI002A18C1B4|nr:hypothetical protein [Maridesulfovibrio sp.]